MRTLIDSYLAKYGFEAFCPKAVLFDMDGVLYNSMPNHVVAWHKSMAHSGLVMNEADAYATEGARGIDTVRELAKQQRGEDITMEKAQEMYDLKSKIFHDMKPQPPIMEGIPQLMAQINASGLQIGIVTGSGQRPLIARLMQDFGQYLTEDHIVTAYDVERGKPNPDPYLAGLRKMGNLNPWEALVVENAPLGVAAGVAARIFTIAVNTGPLKEKVLADKGANLVLARMTDLSDKWNELYSSFSSSSSS